MIKQFFHSDQMRTEFIQLNAGLCRACWKCLDACRRDVLRRVDFLGHRHARIAHPDQCTGCRDCVRTCESGAIWDANQNAAIQTPATAKSVKPFNWRAFVSVTLLISGLMLPSSGIMNHQLQSDPISQQRHFWMSIHNMSALLFTICAILHVKSNFGPLKNYIGKAKGVLASREARAAIALVAGIVGLFASHALHVH